MADNPNMALWDLLFQSDPAFVKDITGKDYRGASLNPYWVVRRLTETFGPAGIGWGFRIDSERYERFGETESLHIARVTLWYVYPNADGEPRRGEVSQIGQTRGSYMTSAGKFKVDEDAPKKSVTDAFTKCASYLGMAGDIFSGRWDDSRYQQSLRKRPATNDSGAPVAQVTPRQGRIDPQELKRLQQAFMRRAARDGKPQDGEAFQRFATEFVGRSFNALDSAQWDGEEWNRAMEHLK